MTILQGNLSCVMFNVLCVYIKESETDIHSLKGPKT